MIDLNYHMWLNFTAILKYWRLYRSGIEKAKLPEFKPNNAISIWSYVLSDLLQSKEERWSIAPKKRRMHGMKFANIP